MCIDYFKAETLPEPFSVYDGKFHSNASISIFTRQYKKQQALRIAVHIAHVGEHKRYSLRPIENIPCEF